MYVASLSGDHIPHTTCRIRRISEVPRNNMEVHMHNRLSGSSSYVDSNVIARWLMLAFDASPCRVNEVDNSGQLLFSQLEYIRNVTSDDDQCVSW